MAIRVGVPRNGVVKLHRVIWQLCPWCGHRLDPVAETDTGQTALAEGQTTVHAFCEKQLQFDGRLLGRMVIPG